MRGFAIHGGEYGVLCSAEGVLEGDVEVYDYTGCKVFSGGGTISGRASSAPVASRLLVSDLTIDVPSMIGLIIHSKLEALEPDLAARGRTRLASLIRRPRQGRRHPASR